MKNIINSVRILWLLVRFPFFKIRKNRISLSATIGTSVFLKGCDIGNYVFIGANTCVCHATIGNYTCISQGVMIGGMEHVYTEPSISPLLNKKCQYGNATVIGNDVWIGANCVIRQGVIIGDGSVVGAGSIVTKDVPENSVVYGAPARVHRQRFDEKTWDKVKVSNYWNCSKNVAQEIVARIKSEE